MKTIFKYPLEITDRQAISLSPSADILCVQEQAGRVCLWARTDPEDCTAERYIRIYGTGHRLAETPAQRYIGTVQTPPFVWHVFEEV